ncbi:MAG: protein translocase subunit SecF [Candidatus Micrarchaeota archaeon]|nr:protein translocase subunit SecF [Candidatus Micrarchaeota archaeon]
MNYKTLLGIPILIFFLSILGLGYILSAGISKDIDFRGGTQITVEGDVPENFEGAVIRKIGPGKKTIIEIPFEKDPSEIISKLKEMGFTKYQVRTVGPSLGENFLSQSVFALCIAFLFMALLVFVVFRNPLPSLYVILAAAFDIIETFVATQFLGIKLSLPVFAALLLLIGYSVDTDILLTTRVLRSEGKIDEKIKGAMKTGLMMTATTLSVLLVLIPVGTVISLIATVLLIGLLFDLVNTWLMNAVMLKWYVQSKR